MNESATGSANSWSRTAASHRLRPAGSRVTIPPVLKLRPPSIDHGVISFLWALGLGLFVWVGLLAVGVSGATAFIFGLLSAFGIFLFVRIFGEEELRR